MLLFKATTIDRFNVQNITSFIMHVLRLKKVTAKIYVDFSFIPQTMIVKNMALSLLINRLELVEI